MVRTRSFRGIEMLGGNRGPAVGNEGAASAASA
jgi:hypothetical protein